MQVDKEAERLMTQIDKNKATIERNILPRVEDYEENLVSSSMSIYSVDPSEEGSQFLSSWTAIVVIHNTPLSMHEEEIYSSPITNKFPSERHSLVLDEHYPSSYNIDEIFGSFTFNIHIREVSWKRVRKVKKDDGTLEN